MIPNPEFELPRIKATPEQLKKVKDTIEQLLKLTRMDPKDVDPHAAVMMLQRTASVVAQALEIPSDVFTLLDQVERKLVLQCYIMSMMAAINHRTVPKGKKG